MELLQQDLQAGCPSLSPNPQCQSSEVISKCVVNIHFCCDVCF